MKKYKIEDLTKQELIAHMKTKRACPSQRELCFIMSERMDKKAEQIIRDARVAFDRPINEHTTDTFKSARDLEVKGWKMQEDARELWQHAMSLPHYE